MCKVTQWMILAFLVWLSLVDYKKKEISVFCIWGFGVLALVSAFFINRLPLAESIGGIMVGMCFFGIGKITHEAVGYGDCWIILCLGICRGGLEILEIVLTASVMAAVFSLVYCMRNGWKKEYAFPYIPFLTVAYAGVVIL